MEEWFEWFRHGSPEENPRDNLRYLISKDVITNSTRVLREYGSCDDGHEGLVYWAGTKSGSLIRVDTVIAPETVSDEGSVTITHDSNFYVVQCLSANKRVHLGQVHSHPGRWVGHSGGDNRSASFKRSGLLSIVVAQYCKGGILPLKKCGVHRFENDAFIRLGKEYVKDHFEIIKQPGIFFDLRNQTDDRWKQKNGIN